MAAAIEPNKRRTSIAKRITPYLMVLPVLIYFIAFWIRPVLQQLVQSFTSLEGTFTFDNFLLVFSEPDFLPALRNTAIIVVFSVTLEFFIALFLALLINRKFPGSSIFLFLAMIPMALPAIAVGAMWKTGLTTNGWINSLLSYTGILEQGEKIYWLAGSEWKLLAIMIVIDAWQVIPSIMIILLAGLQNIPPETEEAGYVFGGDYMTVLRKITMPLLSSTIQTAVILRLIAAIQIWLIVIVVVGFSRMPVLVERIVYYHNEVPRLDISPAMASGYTIIVSVIVSLAALLYLKVSGAFGKKGWEEKLTMKVETRKTITKSARMTLFYLFIITIALTIITPVFFVISLSFLSTQEAYSYPLPLLPTFTKQYELRRGERGYLLSAYDRVEGEYVTMIDTDDMEKMSVYMKSRLGTPITIPELEAYTKQVNMEGTIYFTERTDLLHNYRTFFLITRNAGPAFIRSVQIGGMTILISLSIGGMAGYAFARYRFIGRDLLKFSVLFVRMFPAIAIALPMVIILANMGFYDRPIGLSLVYSIGSIALTVWITASIFLGIPESLEEAAQVFGATKFQSFMRVTLPLALPGLAAAAMYAFLGAWNETVSALILTQFNPTFSVVVYQSLVGATGQVNLAAAGGIVMAIPTVLFTFFIRRYIQQMWGGVTI